MLAYKRSSNYCLSIAYMLGIIMSFGTQAAYAGSWYPAPTNVKAEMIKWDVYRISWTSPAAPTGYELDGIRINEATSQVIRNKLYLDVYVPKRNYEYSFNVQAVYKDVIATGYTSDYVLVRIKTPGNPIPKPTNFRAQNNDIYIENMLLDPNNPEFKYTDFQTQSVTFSWTNNAPHLPHRIEYYSDEVNNGEVGPDYKVEQRWRTGSEVGLPDVPAGQSSVTYTRIKGWSGGIFRISAVNGNDHSDYSGVSVQFTNLVPGNIGLKPIDNHKVKVCNNVSDIYFVYGAGEHAKVYLPVLHLYRDGQEIMYREVHPGETYQVYDDEGLVPGRTYTYNFVEKWEWKDEETNAMRTMTFSSGAAQITVPKHEFKPLFCEAKWDPVTNRTSIKWQDDAETETEYHVERTDSDPYTGAWTRIGTVSAGSCINSDLVFEDASIAESKSYSYKICASVPGKPLYSEYFTACTGPAAPGTLTGNFTATASTLNMVLSWSDNSNTETGYYLNRVGVPSMGNDADFWKEAPSSCTHTDKGGIPLEGETENAYLYKLHDNTTYTYSAYAKNIYNVNSACTNSITITTPVWPATDLTARYLEYQRVNQLSWRVAGGYGEYYLYTIKRKIDDGPWVVICEDKYADKEKASYSDMVSGGYGIGFNFKYSITIKKYNVQAGIWVSAALAEFPVINFGEPAAKLIPETISWADSKIKIQWTYAVSRPWSINDQVEIQRKLLTDSDVAYSVVALVDAKDDSYIDSGLNPATTYNYKVTLIGNGRRELYPAVTTGNTWPLVQNDLPPSNLICTGTTKTTVSLRWKDNSLHETGYRLFRKSGPIAGSEQFVEVAIIPKASFEAGFMDYTDTDLEEYTQYTYKVQAIQTGNEGFSNMAEVTTALAEPSDIVFSQMTKTSVLVTWTDNSAHEDGFKLEMSEDYDPVWHEYDATWVQVSSVGSNVTSYRVQNLRNGPRYYFRVRAFKADTNSSYSALNSTFVYNLPTPIIVANDRRLDVMYDDPGLGRVYYIPENVGAGTGCIFECKVSNSEFDESNAGGRIRPLEGGNGAQFEIAGYGLEHGRKYTFRVYGCFMHVVNEYPPVPDEIIAVSGYSNELAYIFDPQAVAPTNLGAVLADGTRAQLSWVNVDNNPNQEPKIYEDGFIVQRSTDNVTWVDIATTGRGINSYVDDYNGAGLPDNTVFYYRVCEYQIDSRSEWSNVVRVSTLPDPLVAPTGLEVFVDNIDVPEVRLRWNDQNEHETGYQVSLKIQTPSDPGRWIDWDITYVYEDKASYDMTFPQTHMEGATYYYKIRTIRGQEVSPWSPETNISITAPLTKPTVLVSGFTSTTMILFQWADTTDDYGYVVECADHENGPFYKLATLAKDSTSYTLTGLREGVTKYFRVKSIDERDPKNKKRSAWSGIYACTLLEAPAGFTAVLMYNNYGEQVISFQWQDKSAKEGKYLLMYGAGYMVELLANATSYVLSCSGWTVGAAYDFYIQAQDSSSTGTMSEWVKASLTVAAPKPLNVRARALTANSINIEWTLPQSFIADSICIERMMNSGWVEIFKNINTENNYDDTGFDISSQGLAPETKYYYRVKLCKNGVWSAYSPVVSAVTPSDVVEVVARPENVQSFATGRPDVMQAPQNYSIDIVWDDKADNETEYRITRYRVIYENYVFYEASYVLPANTERFQDIVPAASWMPNYKYTIVAVNTIKGLYSEAVSTEAIFVKPCTLEGAPSNLRASVSENAGNYSVNLSWQDNCRDELYYWVEASYDGEKYVPVSKELPMNSASYRIDNLKSGTQCTFRVRAYNYDMDENLWDYTPYSETATVTIGWCVPTSFTANAVSSSEIMLSWTNTADSVPEKFRIEKSVFSDFCIYELAGEVPMGTALIFRDTGLNPEKEYFYRIYAVKNEKDALKCAYASARTPKQVPTAPDNFTTKIGTDMTEVIASWRDKSYNEEGFVIEKSTSLDFPEANTVSYYITDANSSIDANNYRTFCITGFSQGITDQKYYFRLRAYNSGGQSVCNNTWSATIKCKLPSAPESLQATALSENSVKISFVNPAMNNVSCISILRSTLPYESISDPSQIKCIWIYIICAINNQAMPYEHIDSYELRANTKYYYTIVTDNSSGAVRAGCEVTTPNTQPEITSLKINGDAARTVKPFVLLDVKYTGKDTTGWKVRYSNDGTSWSDWEQYIPGSLKNWDLQTDQGIKTVYAQLIDNYNRQKPVVNDTIELIGSTPIVTVDVNNDFKDDIIGSFGQNSVRVYSSLNKQWHDQFLVEATHIARCDINGSGSIELVMGFDNVTGQNNNVVNGLYVYDAINKTSILAHSICPKSIVCADITGDGNEDIVADFGARYGIWVYNYSCEGDLKWAFLHTLTSKSMTSGDINGDGRKDIVIDFGEPYGIWCLENYPAEDQAARWRWIHSMSAEHIVCADITGNGSDETITDFGPGYGIWIYDQAEWRQPRLHSLSSNCMTTGNFDGDGAGKNDVAVDFGAQYGIWLYINDAYWVQASSFSVDNMISGDLDNSGMDELIIDNQIEKAGFVKGIHVIYNADISKINVIN